MFNKLPPVHEWSSKTDTHPLADYFFALEQDPPLSKNLLVVFNPIVLSAFYKKCRYEIDLSSQMQDLRLQKELAVT